MGTGQLHRCLILCQVRDDVAGSDKVLKSSLIWGILKEVHPGFPDRLDMECEKNKDVKNCSNVLATDYKLHFVINNLL